MYGPRSATARERLAILKAWMGHSSILTMTRCVHPTPEHKKRGHQTREIQRRTDEYCMRVWFGREYLIDRASGIIGPMSDVVHIYGGAYETCPVCGEKCAYGGDTNAIANEPVIRPSDWEIELHCPEHGYFRVLAGDLIQPE
jgi:hypothetical protein